MYGRRHPFLVMLTGDEAGGSGSLTDTGTMKPRQRRQPMPIAPSMVRTADGDKPRKCVTSSLTEQDALSCQPWGMRNRSRKPIRSHLRSLDKSLYELGNLSLFRY